MATLSFSFDTGAVPVSRIVDAVAEVHGYAVNIPNPEKPTETIPNPMTKAQFAKQVVKKFLIDTVRNAEMRAAKASLEASVERIDLA